MRRLKPCQHCLNEYLPHALARHEPVCAKRPTPQWLRAEYVDRMRTAGEIGNEIGVSHQSITMWLREIGVEIRGRNFRRPKPRIKARHDFVVFEKISHSCKTCERLVDCERRDLSKEPVDCEAPLESELWHWLAQGFIGVAPRNKGA